MLILMWLHIQLLSGPVVEATVAGISVKMEPLVESDRITVSWVVEVPAKLLESPEDLAGEVDILVVVVGLARPAKVMQAVAVQETPEQAVAVLTLVAGMLAGLRAVLGVLACQTHLQV